MENKLTRNINAQFLILGIYQVIGGFAGLYILIDLVVKLNVITGLVFLLLLIGFAQFAYSVFCGILLLLKKQSGLKHSLINQCFQVLAFSIFGYAYTYISGSYLFVGIDLTESFSFQLNLGLSSVWQISINTDSNLDYVNFNLVALFLILFIRKLKKRLEIAESNTQGQGSQNLL